MSRSARWMSVGALLALVMVPASVWADDIIRIRVGTNDRESSGRELQRRVWELERAVEQLQQRVYSLELTPATVVVKQPAQRWTCSVNAFGKSYVRTAKSRGEAEALVRQECSNESHEMHCRSVQCSE